MTEVADRNWLELLARYRSSDESVSFETVVRPWLASIRRMILMSAGSDSELFDEIQQEVLISLIRALKAYRGESAFSTFLFRIVRVRTIDVLRKKGRQRKRQQFNLSIEDYADTAARHESDPALQMERQEEQQRIAENLASLADTDRLVVQLRLVEGLGELETAQILGLSVPAVKARLFKSRKKLRVRLSEEWKEK